MHKFFLSFSLVVFVLFQAVGQSGLSQQAPDQYYRRGVAFMSEGKFVSAGEAFKIYTLRGDDPVKLGDARYYIGYCALRLKNNDGEVLVEQFIKDYPNHPKAALAYFELGNVKYSEKNYKAAIKYYQKIYFDRLAVPQRDEARFKLGYSYFTQRQFDKAYAMFDELKKKKNKYQYPSSYYAGYINFEKGEYDRSFYDFTRAEKSEAYATVVPSLLVKVYYKQKRYDELLTYAQQALRRHNIRDRSEINLYVGETYFQQKNYEKAAQYFDEYLASRKGKAERGLLFRIATVQMKTGKDEAAIKGFKQVALKSDTLGFTASYFLGNLYLKDGNKTFARAAYKMAMENHFNATLEEESMFKYAKINLDLEHFDEAISTINTYKQRYPGSKRVENIDEILTEAYLNSRNFDKALAYIEKMTHRSARIKKAYQQIAFFKGTELFNDGKYRDAVALFDKSLDYPMSNSFVIKATFWKGEAYSIGLKYDEAIQAYAAVFRADKDGQTPEYLQSRYGIGYAYYNKQMYAKALDHFLFYAARVDEKQFPEKFMDALVRSGDCYYATKQYKLALHVFDEVIDKNKNNADYAYFRQGMIHGILGNLEASNRKFDQLLSDYPTSRNVPAALYQKARFNFESGAYSFAITLFSKLISQFPESQYVPYALQSRAIANTNLKNAAAAESDYKRIIEKYPTHEVAAGALLGLQEVMSTTGNQGTYEKYMAMYRKANPNSTQLERIEFESAKGKYYNQQYEMAISSLKKFIEKFPESAQLTDARYMIADAYYRTGQPLQALDFYYSIAEETSYNRYRKVIQRIAELEYAGENASKSMNYYQKLAEIASTKKEELAAWQGLMRLHFQQGNYEKCIGYGEQIIEKGQVSANAKNEALLLIGKSYLAMGKEKEANDALEKTVASAKDENGAEAQYLLAQMLFDKKLYQPSLDKLFELNASYSIYEKWLGKSFLLIADNYLAMGEDFQAKATLQSIIENSPETDIVDKAKLKLLALEQKAAEEETIGLDTLEVEEAPDNLKDNK